MRNPTRAIAMSAALAALAGCQKPIPELTRAQVQAMPDTEELCEFYHTVQSSQTGRPSDPAPANMAIIRNELLRRGATTKGEWDMTDAGKIQAGMHRCIVFALLGPPVATSVTGEVTRYQFSTGDVLFFQNDTLSSFIAHQSR